MSGESTVSAKKKKRLIIKELVNGQEAATKLKLLLQKPSEQGSFSSEELVANVLRSFTHAISVLKSECHVANRNPLASGQNAPPLIPSGIDPSSGDSTEFGKKVKPSPRQKIGRGCYQRRRSAQACTVVSCTTDDNLAWRKYGQKEILNSEFPRSYFRCTHKFAQGCSAIKQVQQTQENPKLYQITYIGNHTCNDTTKPATQLDQANSLPSLTTKQEHHKESDVTDIKVDPSLWSDLKDLEPSEPAIIKMESGDSIKADSVYSCSGGSQHLDMDFGEEYDHFDTDFHIDECQLP